MIKLVKEGTYRLMGTRKHTTILYLEGKRYAWDWRKNLGQVLVFSPASAEHESYILAEGIFRLFNVKDEIGAIDLPHLQLSLGKGRWQGYLLMNGLPTAKTKRSQIVHTDEIIK